MTTIALRSNVHVLSRDTTFLQIGIHPARSVIVPKEAEALLGMLNGCYSMEQIADALSAKHPETQEIIQALRNNDLVIEGPSKSLDIDLNEIQRLNHVRETRGEHQLAQRRLETEISIYGAGRLGTTIALLLSSSGFPHIRIHDERPVTSDDAIAWGAGRLDIGQRRDRVCALLMERVNRGSLSRQLHPRMSTPRKLAIYVMDCSGDWPWFDPLMIESFQHNETDHVVVAATHDTVRWSSVITPGDTPCTRCEYQRIVDRDSLWPVITQQLRTRSPLDLSPAGLVIAGAAQIVSSLSVWLQGDEIDSGATSLVWPTLEREFSPWSFHPACGCDWMNDARAA